MDEPKTCLVSGGAGFIGSHLCDALLGMGHSVIVVDNLCTGSEDNLAAAKQNPNFTFLKTDVIESPNISQHIDFIFHLASPASVIDYQALPEETALVNSVGTRNLLKLAQQSQARFLFASTSEVYGDPKEHPQKETYWGNVNPNGPRACYDEAKRYGEMMTMLYVNKYHVDGRIMRIFNTYGPRMRKTDGRVISNFLNQALEKKPLTVYGDGSQTRSFCYVSDLVAGIVAYMFKDGLAGEVINLGNPEEISMLELAQKIKTSVYDSSIEYKQNLVDDPMVRKPDITKAKELLSWEPKVSLDEGITKTSEYYRSH